MKYNHKNKSLTISVEDANRAAMALLAAIHYYRKSKGLPLQGFDVSKTQSDDSFTCEYCILGAANDIGLDFGSSRVGELNVSECG